MLEKETRRKIVHLLPQFSDRRNSPVLSKAELGARNFIWVSHVTDSVPKSWTIFSCLSKAINSEISGK